MHLQTERQLAAAGFQVKLADTPDKLAHLQTLPQNKVFPTSKDGEVVYVYADATDCKCVYVGSQVDYQHYSAIRIQQQQINEERAAAAQVEMAEMNAEMNWEMWGGWRRPIIY